LKIKPALRHSILRYISSGAIATAFQDCFGSIIVIGPSLSKPLLADPPRKRVHRPKARTWPHRQLPKRHHGIRTRGSRGKNSHTIARLAHCSAYLLARTRAIGSTCILRISALGTARSCPAHPTRKHGLVFRHFLQRKHAAFVGLRFRITYRKQRQQRLRRPGLGIAS
jgi:hypothetical protein